MAEVMREIDRRKHSLDNHGLDNVLLRTAGNAWYFLAAANIVDITKSASELVARGSYFCADKISSSPLHDVAVGAANFFGDSVVDYLNDDPQGYQVAAVLAMGVGLRGYNRILGRVSNWIAERRRRRNSSGIFG